MSCKNDFLAMQPRKQHSLPCFCSSQHAGPSARHYRIPSSTSLPPYSFFDFDSTDSLDSLSEIALDSDLNPPITPALSESVTLISPRVPPSELSTTQLFSNASPTSSELDLAARLPEPRRSYFIHEPGEMTAQRVQRLRARTAAVIMSMPATCQDDLDVDEDEPREINKAPPVVQKSRLRRVAGISDLRRAFRDQAPEDLVPSSLLGLFKASYELGILAAPTPPLSQLSPRSSLRTLVDFGNGDMKTLCGSTLSSITTSRSTAKVHSISASLSSRPLPPDTSQSISPTKHPVHSPSRPQTRRYVSLSLHKDVSSSRSPGDAVWSCAKISQSAFKRAARSGPTPRRVFSNPIAALSPRRQLSVVL